MYGCNVSQCSPCCDIVLNIIGSVIGVCRCVHVNGAAPIPRFFYGVTVCWCGSAGAGLLVRVCWCGSAGAGLGCMLFVQMWPETNTG